LAASVDFVGILFILWGALTILVGVSTMALAVGAVALLTSQTGGRHVAAGLTVAAFGALAVIAILWGAAHVGVGVPLRRHRHWSRTLALLLGSVDLFLLPYGTALGCYALWVLLNSESKKLFESAI
jgi:hypothetical protein